MKCYTDQKSKALSKEKKFSKRMESCETEYMFSHMLENAEEKD
jgi:hypothetical protein